MTKIKETYLLQTTYTETCPVCRGHKNITEKFYHNQLRECSCYHCLGTGEVERVETVDVTDYLAYKCRSCGRPILVNSFCKPCNNQLLKMDLLSNDK